MRTLLLALLLFSVQISFTQNYSKVDSIVANYPNKFETIQNFADKINSDFSSNLEKTRAAYYWISNHVRYDYKSASNPRNKSMSFTSEERLNQYQKNYAEKALRRRLAVCEGYSQLLKYTLSKLNIKCEVISGFAKTTIRNVGWVTEETNHAWNAVYINNKWQLIDATWSTGNRSDKLGYFDFRDSYFLIKPEHLIWSHYPKDNEWQLLDKPISKSKFFYAPIIHAGYYSSNLELNKMQGILKSKETLEISFDTINEDKQYYYQLSDDSSNLKPIKFIKKDNKYMAQIPYDKTKGKELLIFSGFKACLSFKII